MSLGTQPKALDATAAKPADHPQQQVQPKWDVNHHEVLNQIKQERAARPEVRTAAQLPHRDVQQQQQQQAHPRAEVQRPVPHTPAPVANRPDVQQPAPQRVHPEVRPQYGQNHGQRPEVTQPQIAQNQPSQQHQYHRRDNPTQTQTQHPTEVNRTVINNNQRYEYGNNGQNSNNNNLKYLYGGLAGGALLGGGAAYYANRDNYRDYANGQNYSGYYSDPYRNLNNDYSYNQNNQYDRYANNQFDQYGQYGLSQYDQARYPNGYADNSYANNYGQNYDGSYGNNNSDYLYGGTSYGGSRFANGYDNRPIYETTVVQDYRPVYREQNPLAVIPQLFGTLIGGVLGGITNSNHHRRYYNPADC